MFTKLQKSAMHEEDVARSKKATFNYTQHTIYAADLSIANMQIKLNTHDSFI